MASRQISADGGSKPRKVTAQKAKKAASAGKSIGAGIASGARKVQQQRAKAPARRQAQAQRQPSYIQPASFGGGGGGDFSTFSAMSAPVEPVQVGPTWDEITGWDDAKKQDWVSGDATYTAQQSALKQELDNLIAELAQQRTQYGTDHKNALRNLGWDDRGDDDPTNDFWNADNALGAYGQSYANQENDFAGRGMLDSSAYAEALTNLNTSFDKQRNDLNQAQTNYFDELTLRQGNAEKTHTQDLQRALADAIARRAAREGIV